MTQVGQKHPGLPYKYNYALYFTVTARVQVYACEPYYTNTNERYKGSIFRFCAVGLKWGISLHVQTFVMLWLLICRRDCYEGSLARNLLPWCTNEQQCCSPTTLNKPIRLTVLSWRGSAEDEDEGLEKVEEHGFTHSLPDLHNMSTCDSAHAGRGHFGWIAWSRKWIESRRGSE